ncbi:MAG: hemerythrin domain-containing protein [Polyangiaceae bacterium]
MEHRITELAAKGLGKAKAFKADIQGFRGIFKTLTEEHGQAAVLLKRVVNTPDPKVRLDLWPKLRFQLLAHEHAEVNVLYPVLREEPKTRALAEEHDAQARDLEAVIGRLDRCSVHDPEWHAIAATLQQLVERHVSEEEGKFFPQAQAALGAQRAMELNDFYFQGKPEAETAPAKHDADASS